MIQSRHTHRKATIENLIVKLAVPGVPGSSSRLSRMLPADCWAEVAQILVETAGDAYDAGVAYAKELARQEIDVHELADCERAIELEMGLGWFTSAHRKTGERITCICGRIYEHVCDEYDGCRWDPIAGRGIQREDAGEENANEENDIADCVFGTGENDLTDPHDESMDGDHQSALASAGFGTDEDYGDYSGDEGDYGGLIHNED